MGQQRLKRARQTKVNSSPNSHIVGIVALLCIFVGAPLVGTGHGVELVLLVAVAMLGFLFWRPLQAWAARLEGQAGPGDTVLLEQRLRQLEGQVDSLGKQQLQLQDTVRWQAQLLQHNTEQPVAAAQSSAASRS